MSPSPLFPTSPVRHQSSALSAFQRFSISAFALFAFCLPASACDITLTAGDFNEPEVLTSAGNLLPAGHKASIGTFADGFLTPDGLLPEGATFQQILANWREFTSQPVHPDGSFVIQHKVPDGTVNGFSFPGKKLYLLITRTASTSDPEPLPDGSNVRDFAIFTSAPWVFPNTEEAAEADGSDIATFGTGQIDSAIAGTIDPETGLRLALYSSDPTDPSTPNAFQQWLAETFPGQTVDPNDIVEPLGLPVLAAYALATSTSGSAPAYTTVEHPTQPGRIGITYTRRTAASSGFETTAQASTDLSGWNLTIEEFSSPGTQPDTETVTAYPVFPEGSDQSKAFFRIRVEPAN